MKTYIGVSRDHSISMTRIADAAARDYNSQIAQIQQSSKEEEIDTIASVIQCGIGRPARNVFDIVNSNVSVIKPIGRYPTTGNCTPLFDSIGALIEQLQQVPDANDPNVNFLIMVITDGHDNASCTWSGHRLASLIDELQSTDRWTFTFRVPRGHARDLANMGIHPGNILEWDQTDRGIQESTVVTAAGIDQFYKNKKSGVQSTRSFYNTDLTGVSVQTIKSKLVDISKDVQLWNVSTQDGGSQIRTFCESKLGHSMKRGAAFYLLMKPEREVQDHKQICIRDKKTGAIYSGAGARNMLGLPYTGTVRVVPGNHGKYDIFIQSTSVNRKLVGGTQVLYWDAVGEDYQS